MLNSPEVHPMTAPSRDSSSSVYYTIASREIIRSQRGCKKKRGSKILERIRKWYWVSPRWWSIYWRCHEPRMKYDRLTTARESRCGSWVLTESAVCNMKNNQLSKLPHHHRCRGEQFWAISSLMVAGMILFDNWQSIQLSWRLIKKDMFVFEGSKVKFNVSNGI